MLKVIRFVKNLLLYLQPHVIFGFIRKPSLTLSNTLVLSKWVAQHKREPAFNDYPVFSRDYNKRKGLYQYLVDTYQLADAPISYYEFGVSGGYSFAWWINSNINKKSTFSGFDTFEGLPEDWGHFDKGAMKADMQEYNDSRVTLVKGLFQDSLFGFLKSNPPHNDFRKVIHMDADLFSSTLFCLTTMAQYLNKGDIILFDEFNVPNHESYALNIFTQSYYTKYKIVAAVNNFYQIAIEIQ